MIDHIPGKRIAALCRQLQRWRACYMSQRQMPSNGNIWKFTAEPLPLSIVTEGCLNPANGHWSNNSATFS
jgi:hypothetical protein